MEASFAKKIDAIWILRQLYPNKHVGLRKFRKNIFAPEQPQQTVHSRETLLKKLIFYEITWKISLHKRNNNHENVQS